MQDQTFPVLYQDEYFIVNPTLLYNCSRKFKELIDKAQDINLQLTHLKINSDKFSHRNIDNFLKICQNEQTDAQNSELKEICIIAKMFGADNIYNSGVDFIRRNIDPNFYVPDDQFRDGNQYLLLEPNDGDSPIHHADLETLEFDDESDSTTTTKTETNVENNNNNNNNNNKQVDDQKEIICTSVYQITLGNFALKSRRFNFLKDNKVIYTARVKNDQIFIGKGDNLRNNENNNESVARITRKRDGYNIVDTNDQEFKITYIPSGDKYSLSLSFTHEGKELCWIPKDRKKLTSYKGGYNHIPIQSKKNILLQNRLKFSTFILRKMTQKMFEAECNPHVDPLIVFTIALSEIIGPM